MVMNNKNSSYVTEVKRVNSQINETENRKIGEFVPAVPKLNS